jgi:hypothetical protein
MYKPMTFPLTPEVQADLSDPGSPPEGHVCIAVLCFSEDSDKDAYIARTGFSLPEVLDALQEWEP